NNQELFSIVFIDARGQPAYAVINIDIRYFSTVYIFTNTDNSFFFYRSLYISIIDPDELISTHYRIEGHGFNGTDIRRSFNICIYFREFRLIAPDHYRQHGTRHHKKEKCG